MSAIALFLSLPALLWSGWLVVRGPLVTGCAVALAAMCCLSGELWSLEAGGLDFSLDRFLFIALCLAFAVQWWFGRTEPKPLGWHDAVVAAFLALLVVSTFTHDWRAGDPKHGSILMHLVNGYLVPIGILAIVRFARLDERQWRCALAVLAVFGVYLAVTAILEVKGQWGLVFPSYISDPTRGIHFGRARGPMLQSARLGMYLIACGTVTAVLLAWKRGFRRWGVAACCALLPLYLAAVYFTYTRSVWLGTAVVIFVISVTTLRGRARLLVVGLLVLGLAAVIAIKGQSLLAFKREFSAAETRQSTQMRASFAYVSWQMFLDRPLTGFGFGQFPRESRYYLSDRTTGLTLEHIRGYIHHNTLLSLLVDMGLPALLLFVAIIGHWGHSGWRLLQDARLPDWVRVQGLLMLCVLSAYFVQLLFHEVSYSPVENSLVFFLAGLTLSLRAKYSRQRYGHTPARRLSPAAAG